MILFNTPIRLKHIHKTIIDWLATLFMNSDHRNKNAKLIFIYFSYKPDYSYLKISIKSMLKTFKSDTIKSINIFVDQKDPFEDWQNEELKSLSSKITLHKVEHFSWSSRESTLEELKCFRKVTESSNNEDMLVKVDSDIIFFSSFKIEKILKSQIKAAGDGHYENYKFAQGGLYLIRSFIVKEYLSNIGQNEIEKIINLNGGPAEDRAITKALELNGSPFYLTRLMLFPSEYSRIKRISSFNKFDFCAAHFVKDKEKMNSFYNVNL